MPETVLLTGGAGYIGSHTYIALSEAGHRVVILDDFSNAQPTVTARLAQITGKPVLCETGDVRDRAFLDRVLETHGITAAVHFAAKKSVGESVDQPLAYMDSNLGGLTALMQAMAAHGIFRLVFSSSATVYADPEIVPVPEDTSLGYTNPYGFTKLISEQIIEQAIAADPRWKVGVLRYFNPTGAHPSGLIGEDPTGVPANLMPFVARVALGLLPEIQVFGDDYPTPDGTGVRDYIHVCDLAEGHVASLDALGGEVGGHVVNLGTGQGYSVLELVRAYGAAVGRDLPWKIAPRRAGDIASCYADPTRAAELLGFRAKRGLDEMCASDWHWVQTGLESK